MRAMDDACPDIVADPEIMGGQPVFRGTRVPVSTLWDYLVEGSPLDEFLDHFPSVTREQAQRVLDYALERTIGHLMPADATVA